MKIGIIHTHKIENHRKIMKLPQNSVALVLMILQGLIVSSTATVAASSSAKVKRRAPFPTRQNNKKNRVKNVSSSVYEDGDNPDLFMEEYEYETYDDEEEDYGEDSYEPEKSSDVEKKYELSGEQDNGEDSYRRNDEWWKDPLAQFEDDEEDDDALLMETDESVEDEREKEVPVSSTSDEPKEQQRQQQKRKEEQKTKQPLSGSATTKIITEEKENNSDSNIMKQQQQKQERETPFNNFRNQKNKQTEDTKPKSRNSIVSTMTLQKQKMTKSSPSIPSYLSSAPALPALVLQKLLRNISPHATTTQLFFSLALGNIALYFFQKINKRDDENANGVQSKHDDSDLEDDEVANHAKEETEEYLDEEELERLEELGFGRTINHINRVPVTSGAESDDETDVQYEIDESLEANDGILDESSNINKKNDREFNWGLNSILKFGQGRKGRADTDGQQLVVSSMEGDEMELADSEDQGKVRQKRHKKRKPSISELQSELEFMTEKVNRAEQERELLERENENSHRKLASLQSQLKGITESYDYLQRQAREENQTIESAVRAERQRANEELKRVRTAMVTVLEQERRLMRDQIKQTSAQVRSMMDEYRLEETYGYSSDFDEKE